MYQVTVHHHDKDWVRGDLEDKFELVRQENFKTFKAARDFISNQLHGAYVNITSDYKRGVYPAHWWYFTGVTWQHENSGEMMEEYYQYTLKKVKLR